MQLPPDTLLNRQVWVRLTAKGPWAMAVIRAIRHPGQPAWEVPNPYRGGRSRPGMSDAEWSISAAGTAPASGLYVTTHGVPFVQEPGDVRTLWLDANNPEVAWSEHDPRRWRLYQGDTSMSDLLTASQVERLKVPKGRLHPWSLRDSTQATVVYYGERGGRCSCILVDPV